MAGAAGVADMEDVAVCFCLCFFVSFTPFRLCSCFHLFLLNCFFGESSHRCPHASCVHVSLCRYHCARVSKRRCTGCLSTSQYAALAAHQEHKLLYAPRKTHAPPHIPKKEFESFLLSFPQLFTVTGRPGTSTLLSTQA